MRFVQLLLCTLSTLAFAGVAVAEPAAPTVAAVEVAFTPAPKAAARGLASIFRTGKKRLRSDITAVPSRKAVIAAPPADDFIMQMPISLKRVRPPRGFG